MRKQATILIMTGLLLLALIPIGRGWAQITIDTSSPFLDEESSKTISMDFQDAELVKVLKIFSEQTKYNLITSEQISDRRVTVYLDNVPVEKALEQILRANQLTYELQPNSNIFIVKPISQPDEELVTRVYPLKYATVSRAKLNQTLAISGDEGGGSTCSVGGGGGDGCGIEDAIKAILTPKGKVIEDTRTNSLIITDIASNFINVERTITRLDVAIPQILIEVEMLEVAKDVADQIGIKVGATPLSFSGASKLSLYPFDENFYLAKGQASFGTEVGDDSDLFSTAGHIDASGLTATLQFLKTQTDSKTLARPRILTLNNETAQIKIATSEAIGIETTTSGIDSVTQSAVEAERVETGVFLTVTPQANPSTMNITMAVIPKVIVARTGATFEGKTFKDPEERASQSILKVKSGETIVIGGLLREEMSSTLTKVPILGDIPFLGRAFRHNSDSVEERELIIFLTPHIIDESPVSTVAAKPAPRAPEPRVIIREQDQPQRHSEALARQLAILDKKRL